MTKYNNIRPDASLAAVEFSAAGGQNYAFFHVKKGEDGDRLAERLAADKSLSIVATAPQGNEDILIAKTANTPEAVLASLASAGDSFAKDIPKKQFQGWKVRGALSIVGQGLDIASVVIASKKHTRSAGDNMAYLLFAIFNVSASITNIIFGAKKIPDTQRMHFLKNQINETLSPYVEPGTALPSPDSKVGDKYEEPKIPSGMDKAKAFIQSHSVYIDMGLRTFGNLNLILPVTKLNKPGWKNKINDNPYTRNAGIALMVGKSITSISKVPDPYNPTPPSTFDKFRENVSFRLGNSIESLSAVFMGYNSFAGTKDAQGVRKNNPTSGVANVLFMGGYGARFFAPFGVRKTDVPELEAHVSECLAHVPDDKLPQLVADVSAGLKGDLKDQPVGYGELYTHILEKIEKRKTLEAAPESVPQKTFATPELKRKAPEAATLVERAEKSATAPAIG